MRSRSAVRLLVVGLAVVLGCCLMQGCTANAYCNKVQECDNSLSSDDVGVCIEHYNREINVLRANKEKQCQAFADATLAFDSCRAQLDCGIFNERDLAGRCDQEKKTFDQAGDDARGVNCTSLD